MSSEGKMPALFKSLSGQPMEVSDKDRILLTIMDLPYDEVTNMAGDKVIGLNAIKIVEALKEEGFVILRKRS